MSNYTITTNFGAKDSLPSTDAGKVIKGSEFTTEFTNIQTAIATKADTAGDTFTGVVNFSNDVAVNTNTLFVDVSTAKVGIGTASPANTLTVGNLTGSANDQDATVGIKCNANHRGIILQENSGAEQWEIGVGAAGALKFYDSGSATPAVTFADETGNVGIGTTDPQRELEVTGTGNVYARITAPTDADSAVLELKNTQETWQIRNQDTNDDALEFIDDTGTRLTIKKDGNVGIGTNSPDVKLDVTTAYDTVANVLSNGSYAAKFSSSGSGDTGRTQGILLSGQDGNSRGVALLAEAQSTGNSHDFIIATSSSSATPTERMRIDSSGNVGIGTGSPASRFVVQQANGCVSKIVATDGGGAPSATAQLVLEGYEGRGAGIFIQDSKLSASNPNDRTWFMGAGYNTDNFSIGYAADGVQSHYLAQNMLTIDINGNVLVGKTSSGSTIQGAELHNSGSIFSVRDSNPSGTFDRKTNDGDVVQFRRDGTTVGSVSATSSATSYNTSSDERLKENITDSADAGSKVDAIQIRQFDWKANGSHQDYGVIAQELVTVAPEAVSEGDTEEDMMGVDYSKLVPMLIKEVQSLRSRVAELENV